MSETPKAEVPSKKAAVLKKLFAGVAIIFTLLGINHYTFQWGYGGAQVEVTVTDSTITATGHLDTTITISAADTAKKDTAK
jgi:hypothetical protein